ncbi:carboxypeptidase-like regulatory domain-containing protein [Breoghania sp. L-A4]|uniref:carboxypeptidase-like regulatory domain-containing protein n=1 Tax=Breoghania sp. L-A4 TaxID=2304600 RepID=UPI0013C2B054|nr:carboxypeptidase-like regulatory domain-containing protein [Breoghania sp. L-A4]
MKRDRFFAPDILRIFSHPVIRTWRTAALAAALAGLSAVPAAAQQAPKDIGVSGILYLEPGGTETSAGEVMEIELPDVKVDLLLGGKVVANSAVTQLNGYFRTTAPAPGTYQICWNLGGQRSCNRPFALRDKAEALGRIGTRYKGAFVYGTVLTGDDRPCWVNDSFFGLDVSTEVRGGGHRTRANTQGEYALIGPAAQATFRLAAMCEKSDVSQVVTLGNGPMRRDLGFANRAPQITSVAATDGAKFVTRSTMGSNLKIISSNRDPDGDTVEYIWRTAAPSVSVLSGGNAATEEWKLPSTNGRESVYVMARDGNGGFNYKRFEMQVGDNQIDLSGVAVDETTGNPVPMAIVSSGGASTVTDANGWFRLTTAPRPDDRYVLNISHPNYALMSRVYDRSAYGNTYQMVRAQVTTGSGKSDLIIEDTRSSGPCGASPKGERSRVKRLAQRRFRHDLEGVPGKQDTSREEKPTDERPRDDSGAQQDPREVEAALRVTLKEQQECERRGAQIVVRAGTLVDSNGETWTGAVRASVATLNPARRALPGDYRAITAGGDQAEMLSFGAVYAEFTDLMGNKLNLRPGKTAEVLTPISGFQNPTAKDTIALWSYDEDTGFWMEEGKAEKVMTPTGPAYRAEVEHFSTINMDVAGNDPALATCVRLEIDAAFNGWSNLVLRAYVSYNGDSVQTKETALDNAQYHAIYRIPYGNGFPPNTLRLELRGTSNGEELVLLDDIINTDARPKMTGNDLWPPYPYTECGDPILLTPEPGVVPAYGDLDATGRPAFLSGPFGQFNPSDGAQQVVDYYIALDPGGLKDTLGEWWQVNGFGADGLGAGNPSYVNQAYLNNNDLGFGRDMHCLQSGADVACYVTNYGLPDQNPNNADAAENKDPAQRGATVAMEYDASAPAAERVQFYVFGGGVAGSPRINFADLDGLGPKPVPFLCAVCHGGDSQLNASNTVNHARFREFDLPSFRYSGDRGWDFGQATLNAGELANFANLNELVRNSVDNNTPIADLIDAWYPLGFAGGPAPVQPAVPAGWVGHENDYHEVYGQSCRTCHVARDGGFALVFDDFNDFSFTSYAVCGSGNPKLRFMPNAYVTYKNFWVDALRVAQYETIVGVAAGTCNDP